MIQPGFCPSAGPPIHAVTSQLGWKDATGDCLESLAKVKVNTTHCYLLVHGSRGFLIVEGAVI